MKFEEILPEIRRGRKARRKNYPLADLAPGDKYLDLTVEDVLADDWEIVPGKRKFTSWLKLYDDGSVFGFPSLEKAEESMSLAEHHGKARLVETRMIEWETTDEGEVEG